MCEAFVKQAELEAELQFCHIPNPTARAIASNMPTPPKIIHMLGDCMDNGAWYVPEEDKIYVPHPYTPTQNESYAYLLFHELIHSTLHGSRLNRSFITIGNPNVYFNSNRTVASRMCGEELVAELGAKALCKVVGITDLDVEITYTTNIERYENVLGPEDIEVAHEYAEKAVNYILGYEK